MSAPLPVGEKYAQSSSGSSEASDILDLKDDEGWEDAEPDEEEEHFISLLDDEVFTDINSMLNHCKEKYGFDFLDIRQKVTTDFYDNVKLVNFIRSQVHSGHPVSSNIKKEDFEDEKFLKPVLEDDALLISLDDLPETTSNTREDVSRGGKGKEVESDGLVARISELEEELRRIQCQFNDYRITVEQTLDDRWNDKQNSAGPGPAEKDEKRDDDSHYFSSYSYNGQSPTKNDNIISNAIRYPRNDAKGYYSD